MQFYAIVRALQNCAIIIRNLRAIAAAIEASIAG